MEGERESEEATERGDSAAAPPLRRCGTKSSSGTPTTGCAQSSRMGIAPCHTRPLHHLSAFSHPPTRSSTRSVKPPSYARLYLPRVLRPGGLTRIVDLALAPSLVGSAAVGSAEMCTVHGAHGGVRDLSPAPSKNSGSHFLLESWTAELIQVP
eukprot:COSAG01_NODE_1626_length_9689_cov_12.495412_5_plen_153_part_00